MRYVLDSFKKYESWKYRSTRKTVLVHKITSYTSPCEKKQHNYIVDTFRKFSFSFATRKVEYMTLHNSKTDRCLIIYQIIPYSTQVHETWESTHCIKINQVKWKNAKIKLLLAILKKFDSEYFLFLKISTSLIVPV